MPTPTSGGGPVPVSGTDNRLPPQGLAPPVAPPIIQLSVVPRRLRVVADETDPDKDRQIEDLVVQGQDSTPSALDDVPPRASRKAIYETLPDGVDPSEGGRFQALQTHFLTNTRSNTADNGPFLLSAMSVVLGFIGSMISHMGGHNEFAGTAVSTVGKTFLAMKDTFQSERELRYQGEAQQRDFEFQKAAQQNDFMFQSRLSHKLAKRDQTLSKKMHLIQLYTDMEQEEMALRNEINNANNEAIRDLYDATIQKLQNMLLSSSIMFSAVGSVILQAQLPDPGLVHVSVIWIMAVTGSMSFIVLCGSMGVSIHGLNLVTDAMSEMTRRQRKNIESVVDASKRESEILKAIVADDGNNLDAMWENHAKEMDRKIQLIDEKLVLAKTRDSDIIDWERGMEKIMFRAQFCFGSGTVLMLFAAATFMWANYSEKYYTAVENGSAYHGDGSAEAYFNAGYLSVMIIIFGVFVGMYSVCQAAINSAKRAKHIDENTALGLALERGAPLEVVRMILGSVEDATATPVVCCSPTCGRGCGRGWGWGCGWGFCTSCRSSPCCKVCRCPQGQLKTVNRAGRIPLMIALYNKASIEVVKELHGLWPQAIQEQDSLGQTPLIIALEKGLDKKFVELMLGDGTSNAAKIKNKKGQYPIVVALDNKAPVDVLHAIFAAWPEVREKTDNLGRTPLMAALDNKADLDVVNLVLGSDVAKAKEMAKEKRKDGWTPLMVALYNKSSVDVIKLLEELHPEAVHKRYSQPDVPVIELALRPLLQAQVSFQGGGEVETEPDAAMPTAAADARVGLSALRNALISNLPWPTVDLLIKRLGDDALKTLFSETKKIASTNNSTALHVAVRNGNESVVEGLLKLCDGLAPATATAPPAADTPTPSEWKKLLCNATAEQGRTPLHLACSSTRSLFRVENSIIESLLDHEELAVNTLDSDNNTALHLAAAQGNIDAVRSFFLRKAEVIVPPQGRQDYKDKDRTTGRSYCVLDAPTDKQPGDAFQVFVHRDRRRWPGLAKENRFGEDPVASACSSGNDDMVTFLLWHYIDPAAVTDLQLHYGDLAKKLALPLAVLEPAAAAAAEFIQPGST